MLHCLGMTTFSWAFYFISVPWLYSMTKGSQRQVIVFAIKRGDLDVARGQWENSEVTEMTPSLILK